MEKLLDIEIETHRIARNVTRLFQCNQCLLRPRISNFCEFDDRRQHLLVFIVHGLGGSKERRLGPCLCLLAADKRLT